MLVDQHATGIELVSGFLPERAEEVVVCCGAQQTPQLSKLSGVGQAEEPVRHGIPTPVTAPAVGQNYFDHPVITTCYKLRCGSKGYSEPFAAEKNQPSYGLGMSIDYSLFEAIP